MPLKLLELTNDEFEVFYEIFEARGHQLIETAKEEEFYKLLQ